ncbi:MAG: ATP-binding protein, partial [Sphingomonas sp.]
MLVLRVLVCDAGVGIPASESGKLFRPFQQVQSGLAHKGNGTGLGLSIARGIVRKHGGRIGCVSRLGVGTVFWLEVPALVVDGDLRHARTHSPDLEALSKSSPPLSAGASTYGAAQCAPMALPPPPPPPPPPPAAQLQQSLPLVLEAPPPPRRRSPVSDAAAAAADTTAADADAANATTADAA